MSDLEKTGKKLIDSIRMNKKGSATAAVQSATKKKPGKLKTAAKASPKAGTKPKKSKANRKQTTPLAKTPFQDGSQVWPD